MATNDATLLRIKHQVLNEVAKLAWEGKLEEKRNEIPYDIIPGPKAQFRCCIYREREIIRERIRLAEGLCPSGRDTKNVVQVISSACEDCPIARYVVTDNCQLCMGKACQVPVILALSAWDVIVLILILINARNAASVPRHVLITPLQI